MKVLKLEGFKSLRALNAFHALMLGLKMLPTYMGESYQDFYSRIKKMPIKDQENMIREAVLFVELQEDEVKSLICFCTDKNNVPYTEENLKSLKPDELIEIIVAVAVEVSKIKIDFISETEKKN